MAVVVDDVDVAGRGARGVVDRDARKVGRADSGRAAEFEAGELGGAGRLDREGEGVAVVLCGSGSGQQQETDHRAADSTGAPTYHGKRPRVSHKLPLLSAFLCRP